MRVPAPLERRIPPAMSGLNRVVGRARSLEERVRGHSATSGAGSRQRQRPFPTSGSGRNVLLITADQQRFDALGCHGQPIARTPSLDRLAANGVDYHRAQVQSVVCMPSRSTILTGQYPRTHGVVANGISLPPDAPSVAEVLRTAGYRTALVGKAHLDPLVDPLQRLAQNRLAYAESPAVWHGFEHVELAGKGPIVASHYARWLAENHRGHLGDFASVLSGDRGGDTGAPEVSHNPIPRSIYHTDWIADRTLDWIATTGEQPWFCWMSFPDPHHPFDPPRSEVRNRVDWRDVPLPANRPVDVAQTLEILTAKPSHWLDYYTGRFTNPEGGPTNVVPQGMTDDQVREMTAMIAVENELIDDAVGRVLDELERCGVADTTDVIYASDHGDLGGDHGLVFKGPYHVDSLLRVPLIWHPAPVAEVQPATIDEPVGLIDIAPTICAAAGLAVPDWMQGAPLPQVPGSPRERVVTTWDSQFAAVGFHLASIYRDGWLCTAYAPSTRDVGGRFRLYWALWARDCEVPTYDGSEGELYHCETDPQQRHNLWNDPAYRSVRDDLVDDLFHHVDAQPNRRLAVTSPA